MSASTVPGAEIIGAGLRDLMSGIESAEALLLSLAAPRLRALGLDVPETMSDANERLYRLLAAQHGDAAHSRYNALVRRVVSYQRALACAT